MLPALTIVRWVFKTLKGDWAEWDRERMLLAGMNIPQSGMAVFVFNTRTASVVRLKLASGWGSETVQCTRCVLSRTAGLLTRLYLPNKNRVNEMGPSRTIRGLHIRGKVSF